MYIHPHYTVRWDPAKSRSLKECRGLSFEELLAFPLVAIQRHLGRPNQWFLLFAVTGYIWVAPCVFGEGEVFLKTLYPSRKLTRLWRTGGMT